MISLTLCQTKEAWYFTAEQDGVLFAELTAIPVGDRAVIHNNIHHFSRTLLGAYLEMWRDIRGVLKEAGIFLVVACTDKLTPKIGKWWQMMGFPSEMFGTCDHEGTEIKLAVMEA